METTLPDKLTEAYFWDYPTAWFSDYFLFLLRWKGDRSLYGAWLDPRLNTYISSGKLKLVMGTLFSFFGDYVAQILEKPVTPKPRLRFRIKPIFFWLRYWFRFFISDISFTRMLKYGAFGYFSTFLSQKYWHVTRVLAPNMMLVERLALDCFIFAPLHLWLYYTLIGILDWDLKKSRTKIKLDLFPTWFTCLKFWLPVQGFISLIPSFDLRVLFGAIFGFSWSIYFSWLNRSFVIKHALSSNIHRLYR
eukprot:TRINITY_DN8123_c0_g1_i1.p1 TRINITY_DN8123_c0_g1~~TRINITY_DN8123_c0_g1_i1.p1  ORF type:complete len:248 (-),score=21.52 TRINITY_DN8123_c0_g1_i1:89-832(-)